MPRPERWCCRGGAVKNRSSQDMKQIKCHEMLSDIHCSFKGGFAGSNQAPAIHSRAGHVHIFLCFGKLSCGKNEWSGAILATLFQNPRSLK
jgi:hypothetical protein